MMLTANGVHPAALEGNKAWGKSRENGKEGREREREGE